MHCCCCCCRCRYDSSGVWALQLLASALFSVRWSLGRCRGFCCCELPRRCHFSICRLRCHKFLQVPGLLFCCYRSRLLLLLHCSICTAEWLIRIRASNLISDMMLWLVPWVKMWACCAAAARHLLNFSCLFGSLSGR